MKYYYLLLACLLVVPAGMAVKPEATVIGNVLNVPYTDDGAEFTIRESPDWFMTDDGFYLYVWEYDPDYSFKMWRVNDRTVGVRIDANPTRAVDLRPDVEVCISQDDVFDIPGLKVKDIHRPINCLGGSAVTFRDVPTGRDFTFMVKEPIKGFEIFIGNGAGGGGTIGCVPAPPGDCCEVIGTYDYTPTSTNTETNFYHKIGVTMCNSMGPTCSCAVTFKHKPTTQYTIYSSSYPSTYTNSVLKVVSGSVSQTISGTANVQVTAKCGGKHGTAYARVEAGAYTPVDTTITCTDAASPTITQWQLYNNTEVNSSWINFSCSATDNTGLKYIDLYTNLSGSWTLNQSQSYGNLVYSANKTFSVTGIQTGVNHGWECRARDTNSPTNDAYSGKRYWDTWIIIPETIPQIIEALPEIPKYSRRFDNTMGVFIIGMCITLMLAMTIINKRKKEAFGGGV